MRYRMFLWPEEGRIVEFTVLCSESELVQLIPDLERVAGVPVTWELAHVLEMEGLL